MPVHRVSSQIDEMPFCPDRRLKLAGIPARSNRFISQYAKPGSRLCKPGAHMVNFNQPKLESLGKKLNQRKLINAGPA